MSLAVRITNLYSSTEGIMRIPRPTCSLADAKATSLTPTRQHAHLLKSDMTRNDEQHFMGLRFVRTSALSRSSSAVFLSKERQCRHRNQKLTILFLFMSREREHGNTMSRRPGQIQCDCGCGESDYMNRMQTITLETAIDESLRRTAVGRRFLRPDSVLRRLYRGIAGDEGA